MRLIIFFLILSSCAQRPVVTSFDGKWSYLEVPGEPVKACLIEEDVQKLRELLIRCEGKNK